MCSLTSAGFSRCRKWPAFSITAIREEGARRRSAARLSSPAAGAPGEPGDSPPALAVGLCLVQVLLLPDEIKNVGGVAVDALAREPEGRVPVGVPRRPRRGRRAGIRHRRWFVHWSPPKS